MDIDVLSSDPLEFIRELNVSTSSGVHRFADVMAPFQEQRFAGIAPALLSIVNGEMPSCRRFWWEATKGGSKDTDATACLLYVLAFHPTGLRVQVAAADEQQAAEVRLIVKQLLKLDAEVNTLLSGLLEVQADKIINRTTGSVAEILTRDASGSHGSRPDVVFVNELSHISDSAFPETLMDNADKVARSVVLICTNAGSLETWQARWREIAMTSARWQTHVLAEPSPWVSAADLAESEKRNSPSRFLRLWHGVWSSGEGDLIDREQIRKAISLSGPTYAPRPGFAYFIGGDLALRRDAAALVLVARDVGQWIEKPATERPVKSSIQLAMEDVFYGRFDGEGEPLYRPSAEPEDSGEWRPGTGTIELAQVLVFQPRRGGEIDLSEIERAAAELSRAFNAPVLVDEYQAALLAQRLRTAGIMAQTVPPTAPVLREQAQAILDGFSEGTFKLFDHPALLADIRRWRLVEKSYGLRLESPSGVEGESTRHGDAASAYALAVLCARRFAGTAPVVANNGAPLLCWP